MIELKVIINDSEISINPETINTDDRLDEALDSATFCFMSNVITSNIEPFTIFNVYKDGVLLSQWYCSSTCEEIVETPGYYYHSLSIIEPLKILETFIIGTKAFSVADDEEYSDYSYNWFRLKILNDIVSDEYNFKISLDDSVKTKFTEQRAYSYGSGTTYFDIASDIMKTQGCFPRVLSISKNALVLGYTDIDALETETITNITKIIKVSKSQSVDDYCNDVVTEMNTVVDRDTITKVNLSPRSSESFITTDNACLKLNSNVESVKRLYIDLYGFTGPTCKMPYSNLDIDNFSKYVSGQLETFGDGRVFNTVANVAKGLVDSTVFTAWAANYPAYSYCVFTDIKDEYIMVTLVSTSNSDDCEKYWTCVDVIDKDNYELLTAREKTSFIYYDHESNLIQGFREYNNTSLYDKAIYGENGPFIKELYLMKLYGDTGIHNPLYSDFDEKATAYNGNKDFLVSSYYHVLWPQKNTIYDDDILTHIFKIEYYVSTPLCMREYKTNTITHASSRSYNNGASTVDFNQLVPAIKRSVDMLGLVVTAVESLDDSISVGTRTQYGYVVSKQSQFNIYDGEKVVKSVIYNCSDDFHQIAQSIGVRTQYEATNVPATGIVTRYFNGEATVTEDVFDLLLQQRVYLQVRYLTGSENHYLTVNPTVINYGDISYFIFESEDNYTFARKKTNSDVSNYYLNKRVEYADSKQIEMQYVVLLLRSNYEIFDLDALNEAPDFNILDSDSSAKIAAFSGKYFWKDPREKVVFQIRVNKQIN